jgi:membrane-bound lytic murein transglycosylase D
MGKGEEFSTNLATYDKPLVSWKTYQAKRGERLDSISSKFGISVAQLRDVNDISGKGRLKPNQPILVPTRDDADTSTDRAAEQLEVDETAAASSADEPSARRYKVRKGDSVYSIAKRHGMTTRQLMAMNGLRKGKLRNGQVLSVAAAGKPPRVSTRIASASGKTRYTVKRGETLSSIAKKFNVAASDLKRWNNLSNKRNLMPGRKLLILKEEA